MLPASRYHSAFVLIQSIRRTLKFNRNVRRATFFVLQSFQVERRGSRDER